MYRIEWESIFGANQAHQVVEVDLDDIAVVYGHSLDWITEDIQRLVELKYIERVPFIGGTATRRRYMVHQPYV
jgi:hypothetical protein